MTAATGGEGIALDCLLGRCDSLRADVYFRATLPAGLDVAAAKLSGTLAGPDCAHAITLPVTATLAAASGDTGSADAPTLVARTILTEPASWTPELPNLYRLDARLEVGGRHVAAWRQPVGLRRLGIRGRSLWLDGRRHVPRGLVAGMEAIDLAAFRAAALAAVVPDPSGVFLGRCDAEGVVVVGLLADETGRLFGVEDATAAVTRWAWHPSVFVAVVPRGVSAAAVEQIATTTRKHRGTLLLAWEVDGSRPPPAVAAGVDLLVVTLPAEGVPHEVWRAKLPAVPLVARRPSGAASAPAMRPPSRRECDSLQAALAGWGTAAGGPAPDWAGYVVG